jgi:hypothetical protein
MRRRLYYVFPSQEDVHKVVNELLLQRIEISHMHVMGPEGTDTKDLPMVTTMQKNDAIRGMLIGCCSGAIVGIIGGIIGHYIVDVSVSGAIIATTIMGAVIGGWGAGLIATSKPNPELKKFYGELKAGHYLLMVDIPKSQADTIANLIKSLHPEANYQGIEPTIPKFP